MRRTLAVAVVAAEALLSSCGLIDGGGGGGGPGGTADAGFSSGFTYVRRDDRNVYLVDLGDLANTDDDGMPVALTTVGAVRQPSLSPDGRRVVFATGSGLNARLATVPVGGGAISVLLVATASARNFANPVYSPDGSRVAFSYDDGTLASSVGVINVDGSGFTPLAGGGALSYGMPSFFPTGAELLAGAGVTGSQLTQVERITIATRQAVNVTNALLGPGADPLTLAGRLVVSPAGTEAVFDARLTSTGVTRVFRLDLSSRQLLQLNENVGEPSSNDSFPCWIDATTVAYSSDSGGNDNVYRVGRDGTGRRLLLPKALEPWFGVAR